MSEGIGCQVLSACSIWARAPKVTRLPPGLLHPGSPYTCAVPHRSDGALEAGGVCSSTSRSIFSHLILM